MDKFKPKNCAEEGKKECKAMKTFLPSKNINIIGITRIWYGLNLDVKRFLMNDNLSIKYLIVEVHKNFPNLIEYIAENCRLLEIRQHDFALLKNLQFLSLNHNKIDKIDARSFEYLTKLEILDLSSNKFQAFDENVFRPLKELKTLDLSSNNLKDLQTSFIQNNFKLQNLILRDNKIEKIYENFIPFMIKNEYIFIDFIQNACINEAFKIMDANDFNNFKRITRTQCS